MRQRFRIMGFVALAAAGAVGTSACGLLPEEEMEDDTKVSEKIVSVRLDTESGDITLRGEKDAPGVSLHREIEYSGEKPGASHSVQDGVLTLKGCGEDCEVSYTVDLPAGLPVSGSTSHGDITLRAMGTTDVSTSNGDVKADGLTGRSLRAESSNGSLDLSTAVPQDIRVNSSNGDVTVHPAKGPYRVEASTSNGDKTLKVPDEKKAPHLLDLSSSNGDITVE
ncbi:DUF4097 domain-containing protein [Streptomyces sp. NPDC048172]|uniref:DUF4097 family beta strand repeat-containing protein n=1 Tax=Streptomyces sp. NPDC048172 TaxID=3365505 RepID=UPI003711A38F